MTPTLFQRALGAEFFHLAPVVKQLHGMQGNHVWRGEGRVMRGNGVLAALCARATQLPGNIPVAAVAVRFEASPEQETWQRTFNDARFSSRLRLRDGLMQERLGPIHFAFRLYRHEDEIRWTVERARLFGLLPLPAAWFDAVRCREFERDGRYHFDVDAAMPLVGQIVRYEGWLEPAT